MKDDFKDPIVNKIEKIVSKIPGWSPPDELLSLFLLAYSNAHINGNFIEIGSWCGRSSVVLGLAAQLTNVERVLCVDLFPNKNDWYTNKDWTHSFKVTLDKEYYGYVENNVFDEPFVKDILPVYKDNEDLLEIFYKNIFECGMSEVLMPIKGTSDHIKRYVKSGFKCKFAFIDGCHDYNVVCNDISNVEKYFVPGAWICFDDAFVSYKQVSEAIEDKIINNDNYCCKQQITRKFFVARKL